MHGDASAWGFAPQTNERLLSTHVRSLGCCLKRQDLEIAFIGLAIAISKSGDFSAECRRASFIKD
jgi:hypothetical protein